MEGSEFTEKTKRTLASRAGYTCSVPECNKRTIGPGSEDHEISSDGCACHIYSAKPKGPRGSGGLSDDQLKDISNGIWCCRNHGTLIDTNQGNAFPASLLKSWKLLHEERIKFTNKSPYINCGFARNITISDSP